MRAPAPKISFRPSDIAEPGGGDNEPSPSGARRARPGKSPRSSGPALDLGDAEKVARDFVNGSSKHQLAWQGPAATLPKDKVKLLLNLVALGIVALPRGGTVEVEIAGSPPDASFTVKAKGEAARLTDQVQSLLSGANGVAIDAHSIQPYYASRVAKAAGMTVTTEARDGEVELKAV